jgi:class 3 adenylate cyclase
MLQAVPRMEPQIRFCSTTDGVRIAFGVTGDDSTPGILVPSLLSPTRLIAHDPVYRAMAEPAERPLARSAHGTAVILFADIVDSTGLTERLGDEPFRDRARALDEALRAAIRDAGGTPVEGKLLGDGVLAVFASAREALEAAVRCRDAGALAGLVLHLGAHAGDVIRERDNVYGGAVNVASRIAAAAAPSEVLVSETVRSLARTSAGMSFADRGEHRLKGVSEPVRLWAVADARDT